MDILYSESIFNSVQVKPCIASHLTNTFYIISYSAICSGKITRSDKNTSGENTFFQHKCILLDGVPLTRDLNHWQQSFNSCSWLPLANNLPRPERHLIQIPTCIQLIFTLWIVIFTGRLCGYVGIFYRSTTRNIARMCICTHTNYTYMMYALYCVEYDIHVMIFPVLYRRSCFDWNWVKYMSVPNI